MRTKDLIINDTDIIELFTKDWPLRNGALKFI